jgi:16S rRNA (cytosine1402-N4)-methyltransferase
MEVSELAAILYEFGEERHSRRIARAIVEARPITTTIQLSNTIKAAYPGGHSRGIHPARRSFQALRIYVNDELGALAAGLAASRSVLRPDGVLAVLSFHSLEDRLVKRLMRDGSGFVPISKKPIIANEDEVTANPRARSAKLRAALWQPSQLSEQPDLDQLPEQPDLDHISEQPDLDHISEQPDLDHISEQPDLERVPEQPKRNHVGEDQHD